MSSAPSVPKSISLLGRSQAAVVTHSAWLLLQICSQSRICGDFVLVAVGKSSHVDGVKHDSTVNS